MNLKNKKLLSVSIILLLSTMSFADKPSWAGNGGKASDNEKRKHKKDMTSKNEDKKYKKKSKDNKNDSYEREYNSRETSQRESRDTSYQRKYEGQGQTDKEFIEEKTDETKKNWMGKFFNFLN